jgi:hypothetical protein
MSLLISASEWSSETQPNLKRQSTIRNKTVKKQTHFANLENINKFNSDNVERNERVNKMIHKITSLNKSTQNEYADDDANNIPDFNPMITNYSNDDTSHIHNNTINDNDNADANANTKVGFNDITDFESDATIENTNTNANSNTNVGINTLGYYNSVNSQKAKNGTEPMDFSVAPMSGNYSNSDVDLYNLSNYAHNYKPQSTAAINTASGYYSSMGLGKESGNSKIMERINYMIHMLEEQQHEKTNNITEEFILYVLLGVFTIFIVDSFSNIGKYTR